MGKEGEENKQTAWNLWKHSIEQEKDIGIQQSQNKSILLKTICGRILEKKNQNGSIFI